MVLFYYILYNVYFVYFIQQKHFYFIKQHQKNTADWRQHRSISLYSFGIFDNHMRYHACLVQLSINHEQLFTTGHNCQPN